MAEPQYGIIKAKIKAKQPEFPPRGLLRVPHRGKSLVVAYPAFGPGYFEENVTEMQKSYSHPQTGETISFRTPTTAESISAAAYNFKIMAKPQIFDSNWFQIEEIVRTSEGVFANTAETDERKLKALLDKAKKVNGIYLCENDIGFAPYETFKQEVQDAGDFAESGLARVLEHTEKTAENLKEIASKKNYPRGVNVWGFDSVSQPVLRVASLSSRRNWDDGQLNVYGLRWPGVDIYGYAFGVLE